MESEQIRITWKGLAVLVAVPVLLVITIWALRLRDRDRREEQIAAFQAYVAQPQHDLRLAPYIAAFHPNDSSSIARIQEVLHVMNMEYGPMSSAQLTLQFNGLFYHLSTNNGYSECIAPEGYKYLTNDMLQALMALPVGTQLSQAQVLAVNGEKGEELEAGVRCGQAALLCTAYRSRFDDENTKEAEAAAIAAMEAAMQEATSVQPARAVPDSTIVTGP